MEIPVVLFWSRFCLISLMRRIGEIKPPQKKIDIDIASL
jgi:hypothetical protein